MEFETIYNKAAERAGFFADEFVSEAELMALEPIAKEYARDVFDGDYGEPPTIESAMISAILDVWRGNFEEIVAAVHKATGQSV